MTFNKVILAGYMARDPETRYTPKGTAVCNGAIACNRKWRTEDGEEKQEVTFVDFDCFGRTAELIAQYLKKGSGALIEGRLKQDSWDDKQTGQKRTKLKVIVETVQFIGTKGESDQGEPDRPPARRTERPASNEFRAPVTPDAADDDVPF